MDCGQQLLHKGAHSLTYRTLFGTLKLNSQRLFHCPCQEREQKSIKWDLWHGNVFEAPQQQDILEDLSYGDEDTEDELPPLKLLKKIESTVNQVVRLFFAKNIDP